MTTRPRPDRHGNDESGFTLIEVVMAVAILTIAIFAVTQLMATGSQAASSALLRDRAQQLADQVLERAQSYGCGLDVGSESTTATGLVATRQHNCFSAAGFANFDTYPAITGYTTGGASDGDTTFTTTVGAFRYTVRYATAWQQIGTAAGGCPGTTSTPNTDRAAADGIDRSVTVAWLDQRTVSRFTTSDYEAVPPDATTYHDLSRGGLLFTFPAGTNPTPIVTLSVNQGNGNPSENLSRYADPNGCVFFPFLPPSTGTTTDTSRGTGTPSTVTNASYTYTVNGAPGGGSPIVSSSNVTVIGEP